MKIDNVKNISTKKGDSGTSRNYSNEAFSKDDIVFETLGTNDELSSVLGLAYHATQNAMIKTIQRTIQDINALIATNPESQKTRYEALKPIKAADIEAIEQEEAQVLKSHPIEPRFFLPGSETTLKGAHYDYARTVCRRAERMLVRFINMREREDLSLARQYLNRLSDLLFIWARRG